MTTAEVTRNSPAPEDSAAGVEAGSASPPVGAGAEDGASTLSSMIMVVDDVALNVKLACAYLESAGYRNLVTEGDSRRVLDRIRETPPDLLLLDLMMPEVSGIDLLQAIRSEAKLSHIPVLILTATTERRLKILALESGATDFLNKPLDPGDLVPRVRNALLVKSYQDDLESKVEQRTRELSQAQREVVYCLARAAEYRDNETGRHVIRVSRYVAIIAREAGLDRREAELMALASTLHDVGKIGIPDSILRKPAGLTEDELAVMRKHCDYGADICSQPLVRSAPDSETHLRISARMLGSLTSPLLRMASSIAATHHEKWDGSGYPRGLRGGAIPLEGRITAVADVFDALSSKRPYKEAFPLEKCISILEAEKGKHFEPRLVDLFLGRLEEVSAIRDDLADA